MANGTIKRIMDEKGYGFISMDDGREVFFHRSVVEGTQFEHLRAGDKVECEPDWDAERGPRAIAVRPD